MIFKRGKGGQTGIFRHFQHL